MTSDSGDAGGLDGNNFAGRGTARDSYWDTQTSGQSESAGGEGKDDKRIAVANGLHGHLRELEPRLGLGRKW